MKAHHVVVSAWDQGGRKGEPYIRMYEVRCGPCKWRTDPTPHQWQAHQAAADHQGKDTTAPPWARGPGGPA